MADQVIYWADHPEEREAVGATARKVGLAKFDRKQIAGELAAVFEEVVLGQR
jgi:glycosyltransferase involved in cell wall biosynthesis